MTGEDIYGLEACRKLCDEDAVDLISPTRPRPAASWRPSASVTTPPRRGRRCPCTTPAPRWAPWRVRTSRRATETFVALEYHATDVPFWNDLVQQEEPLMNKGWYQLTDKPGLGIEMDEKEMAKHPPQGEALRPDPEWSKKVAWDRTWADRTGRWPVRGGAWRPPRTGYGLYRGGNEGAPLRDWAAAARGAPRAARSAPPPAARGVGRGRYVCPVPSPGAWACR